MSVSEKVELIKQCYLFSLIRNDNRRFKVLTAVAMNNKILLGYNAI
jgi:hypothetical protein